MQDIRKRAESGSAEAQFEMGTFYELGFTSVPADSQKAMEWYRKAAEQGHVLAREGLEDLSREGATLSPGETLKQTTRRTSRQQLSSSALLNAMDAKARDAIKKMKE
jgi:TPR repeat protein